jgi:small subunit ribosomal protein S1
MKQLLPSPWDSVEDWIVPGETVVGHVTRVLHFGAFVDLGNGIEGLLHSTEIPSDGGAEVVPGCELTLRVVSLDTERQRVGLSLRDLADEQKQRDDAEPTLEADAEAALISETPEEADEIEPEDMSNIDETVGQLPD